MHIPEAILMFDLWDHPCYLGATWDLRKMYDPVCIRGVLVDGHYRRTPSHFSAAPGGVLSAPAVDGGAIHWTTEKIFVRKRARRLKNGGSCLSRRLS